ncbi:MBL fold metallo-hydrolase [Putridiphycobacter roseus]|nr:MBL fold metallo-hydrolase [Putridiphycobacter roseus]
MSLIIAILLVLLVVVTFFYVHQSQFGNNPTGARLERIKQSPNFKDGTFQNLNETPQLAEGYSVMSILYDFLFVNYPHTRPIDLIPAIHQDLKAIPLDKNVLVWFGHSSYYLQLEGKRILIDPVFSGNASPIPGSVKAFAGTDVYAVADFPKIDVLFISHDHYDHVDHKTLLKLKEKVGKVICGLGVGAHFEEWGYAPEKIIEKDWYESVDLGKDFKVFVTPSRHFSGRGFSRNNTLWVSFVLKTPKHTLFLGGDSGYDSHYLEIGKKYGPIDLAILENGQYNPAWPYVHHQPEQVLQAAKDLGATRIFPVHSSKFALSNHPWDEPLKEIVRLNATYDFPLVIPIIGEIVYLDDSTQVFTEWWKGVE